MGNHPLNYGWYLKSLMLLFIILMEMVMPSYSGDACCVDKVGDSLINAYGSWCSYGHGHNCWCYCIEAYPFNPRHYGPITTRPITCHGAHGMHKCILGHPTHQTRHHTYNNQPTNQLTNQPTIDLLDIYLPYGGTPNHVTMATSHLFHQKNHKS